MFQPVVEEILVYLIRDHEEIVLQRKPGNHFHLFPRENFSAGIGRRVDYDSAGPWRDRFPQPSEIDAPTRLLERKRDWLDAQSQKRVHVVAIERFEKHNLVSRVQQRKAGGIESARRPRGDDHLVLRVDGEAVMEFQLGGNRFPQRRDAVRARVYVVAVANRPQSTLNHHFGDRSVAYALRQVDTDNPIALHRHRADLRLHYVQGDLAETKGIHAHPQYLPRNHLSWNRRPPSPVVPGLGSG